MGIVLDSTKCFLPHPNEEILDEYVLGRLPEALAAQIEERGDELARRRLAGRIRAVRRRNVGWIP